MNEPKISVGIMESDCLRFRLVGNFVCGNGSEGETMRVADGEYAAMAREGKVEFQGRLWEELRFDPDPECSDARFDLMNVTIGVNFHWERCETQRFAGVLRVIVSGCDATKVVAVNETGVEEYLKSVISSEMSAQASVELLKAHAVISRSWLLRQLVDRGKHVCARAGGWKKIPVDGMETDELVRWYDREDHSQFDVCADDHCQRYQGVTRQSSPCVAEAVEVTRGVALTFGGEICDARFSKCCGGRSELFENCWEDSRHEYLESVADRKEGMEQDFCDSDDDDVLSQVLNSYDLETKDFYRWNVRYDKGELGELIRRRSGLDLGTVVELRPLERGASGRVVRLFIRGEKGSVVVGKELEIRRWLSESHLKSSAFEVADEGDAFVLYGKGWGHGVGLCQIGAAVMGANGYGYEEILNHYFPKAELTKLYE